MIIDNTIGLPMTHQTTLIDTPSLAVSTEDRAGFSTAPKRKVLMFYQDFGQMGGIEQYLVHVGQTLAAEGLLAPVFVCSAESRLYERLRQAGLKTYGVASHPVFGKSFLRSLDLKALFQLKRVLDIEKPDVVNVHIGLLETLLIKWWGYPVVFTFHGYGSLYSDRFTQNPLKRGFKALVRQLFQWTAKGLDRLLLVSHAEQNRLLQEGYLPASAAGEVMHNGVSVSEIQRMVAETDVPAFKRQLGLPEASRVVTFINRLDANKNPCHFLALARRFASQPGWEDCQFVIAGDGPLAAQVQEAASRQHNVHYLGYREDVPALLAITDVLVYPTLAEGFGLGLVEAMAAGVPCVAYASEGATEILDTPETRFALVPVGQLDALADKLQTVMGLPKAEQDEFAQALLHRVNAFDSVVSVQKLQGVYQQLLPKISILLPVYNGADCILKAVRSVLSQSYPHWELIVVDDGSTDDTVSVLSIIQDERVRVIRCVNQGVAAARNTGFSQATGDYIAFIDADDIWLPNKLVEEVQVIRNYTRSQSQNPTQIQTDTQLPRCLIYSAYFAVDEQGRLVNLPAIHRENGDLSESVLAQEGIFLPSTALVHREVFEALGGFQSACYHEDRVFFIQACQQYPAYATGKRLVLYRQSLSGRCRAVLQNYSEAVTAELSIVETLQGSLSQEQLALLRLRQQRNLICRFLMYNYREQAQQLLNLMPPEERAGVLSQFSGKKGRLAILSLNSGLNVLFLARAVTQSLLKWLPLRFLLVGRRPEPIILN